ncbi:MAG: PEP-CTERM sorting domain-containing protein [Armatimonadetes bacterium]|nr:PEP-CTERM sorting domain-containing protein [Armatimonadota bacterium]
MSVRSLSACVGLAILAVPSFASTTINFDNVAAGTVITTQYAGVTFSSNSGQENRAEAQNLGSSLPNFICTFAVGGSINCVNDTYVDFAGGVSNLSFLAIGADNNGHNADVDVFINNVFDHTVQVIGNGTPYTPDLVTIAGSNITRIEIKNITDGAGLGWDDFTYDAVPEPGTLAALGFGAIALIRRRKN